MQQYGTDEGHLISEIADIPADFYLQQALMRKRDLKGGYKAKLALEKLILDHERKRALLSNLYSRQAVIQQQLDDLKEHAGTKESFQEEVKAGSSKTH